MYSLIDVLNESLPDLRNKRLRPITVAVLDTGVDSSHELLKRKVTSSFEYVDDGNGIVSKTELPQNSNNDDAGHGTAVAGIVVKIAPNAKIADYKVLNAKTGGSGKAMLAGLKDAIESDAGIINMSLACLKKYKNEISELLELAYRKNKIIIASKRNTVLEDDMGFPAELANCISVENKNFGNNPFFVEHSDIQPIEFSAHGVNVLAPKNGGGYHRLTGTSFATPTVSGMVALLLGAYPELELFELKSVLKYFSLKNTFKKTKEINPLEVACSFKSRDLKNTVLCNCPDCSTSFRVHSAFSYAKCPECGRIFPLISVIDRNLWNEVINRLTYEIPVSYHYHNKLHTQEVVANVCTFIRKYSSITKKDIKILMTAALFHDTGYIVKYENNEDEGAGFADKILPKYMYTESEIQKVKELIMATKVPVFPKNLSEKIICDADVAHIGTKDYFEKSYLLRKELEYIGVKYTNEQWRENEIAFLKKHHFHQKWLENERKDKREKDIENLRNNHKGY